MRRRVTNPAEPHLVIIPRRPGRLLYLSWVDDDDAAEGTEPRADRPDRLFGRITSEPRGPLDVALVAIGLGLFAWSLLEQGAPAAGSIGILSIVLGLAIPARDAAHALDNAWAHLRDRFDRRRGVALDVDETNVARLVIAYDDVFELARKLRNRVLATDARRLAHASILELAADIPTTRPTNPRERELVRVHARALRRVDDALKRATSERQRWRISLLEKDLEQRREWQADIARAREEALAAEAGGLVARLEALATRIETEAGFVLGH